MADIVALLIVENSAENALLSVERLRQGGLDCTWEWVGTPAELHAALARRPWDVLIADYDLPGLAAAAVLAILQDQGLDIPVIVVSDTPGERPAVAMIKAGAQDYVLKSDLTRLPEAVRESTQCPLLTHPTQRGRAVEQPAAQSVLHQRDFSRLMVEITSRFVDIRRNDFDEEVERSLALIGQFLALDHGYVVVLDKTQADLPTIRVTHQWYCSGCAAPQLSPKPIPISTFPWAVDQLHQRRGITIPSVAALPEECAVDRRNWQRCNIQAVLSVPLVQRASVVGHVGLISFSRPVRWDDNTEHLLQVLAQTIAHTQERLQAEAILAQREAQSWAMLSVIPDLLVRVGADGYYREVLNPGHPLDIVPLGKNRVGRCLHDLLPAELADRKLQAIHQALATGEMQTFEQQLQVGDRLQQEEVRTVPCGPDEVLLLIRDISDRKHWERALQQSEAHFRALINALPDLLVRLNREGIYLEFAASPTFAVVGDVVELVGTHVRESLPPGPAQQRLEAIDRALDTQTIQIYEQDLSSANHIQIEEVRVVPYREDEVLAVVRDISDRKRIERQLLTLNQSLERQVADRTTELQEREARYRALMDGASDAIIVADMEGHLLEVNHRATELFGYSRAQFTQMHQTHLHPPEQRAEIEALFATLTGQDNYQATNVPIVRADGQQLPVDFTSTIITLGETQVVQGILRDVSDRQRIEAENQQLRDRLEFLLSSSPAVIYSCKTNGDYGTTFMSANIRQVLGYEAEQFIADSSFWIDQIHPDDRETVLIGIDQLLGAGHRCQQYRFRHSGGQYVWMEDCMQLVRDAQGQIVEVIGFWANISDRKQAEIEREEMAQRLAIALASAEIGCWELDLRHNTLRFDERLFALYDLPLHGDAAKTALPCEVWADRLHPEDRPAIEALLQRVLRGEAKYDTDFRIVRPDGSSRHIKAYGEIVPNAQGHPTKMIGVNFDITDRKQAECALQASESKYRRLTENIPSLIFRFIITITGQRSFPYVSPRVQEIFEVSPAEAMTDADALFSLVVEADREALDHAIVESAQQLTPFRHESRIVAASGTLKWLRVEAMPQRRPEGGVMWEGFVLDISDRKFAEEKIQQQANQEKILREIALRVRQSLDLPNIFNTACQEIRQLLQADRVGIFKFYPNSGYAEGTFVAEAVQAPFVSVLHAPVQDHCFGDTYAPFYLQGRYAAMEDIFVLKQCHTDVLAQFQVRANLVMPLIQGQQLWGLLCVHQCSAPRQWQPFEIELTQQLANQLAIAVQQANLVKQLQQELTERQQTQQQLTLTNAELVRATRLKDEFLANMSHELRTPLNAILGMTEGLQDEVFGCVNEPQLKALDTVESSASHLLALINDILDVAKIESGQIDLDLAPTPIAPLCQASLSFVRQQAYKKSIRLIEAIPPHLPNLVIDERRLRQVLINLLNNAVKFTPEGGQVRLQVSLETVNSRDPHPVMRFSIEDTGIGIAPEDIAKLFQPFIQIDSALNRQYEGTGLGLTLVKQLVELHGGQVNLTSEVGQGSCFSVDLPYTPSPSTGYPAAVPSAGSEVAAAHPPLILLAANQEASTSTLVHYLSAKGYRLLVAQQGAEAVAQAQAEHPDLVVIDTQLPGDSGLEAIRRLRTELGLVDLPILALTTLAESDRCLAAGANQAMGKPIKLKQLTAYIQHLLPRTD